MWIMVPEGFVSVVDKDEGDDLLTMRARDLKSLTLVLGSIDIDPRTISDKGGTDYPYRAKVTRKQFKDILGFYVDNLDYYNFKDEADIVRENKYHVFLSKVWVAGLGMEKRGKA